MSDDFQALRLGFATIGAVFGGLTYVAYRATGWVARACTTTDGSLYPSVGTAQPESSCATEAVSTSAGTRQPLPTTAQTSNQPANAERPAPSGAGPLKLPHAGSSGWRTPWIDSLHLAQGFHRETGASASTGIKYITSDEPRWTCSPESSIKVLSKSQDYSDMLTVGGSMSFEGWGASAETSFQVAKHVKTSIKAVTGTVSMRYISEKIDIISPADKSQQVTLTPGAAEMLETKGPIPFHAEYGSHFVSGYNKDIVKHDFGVDLVPICGWPLCWQLCDGVCRC
ncbi:TPA: hypothetical protein ACH3X3_006546 [Trebouxia sp. C0006]